MISRQLYDKTYIYFNDKKLKNIKNVVGFNFLETQY